MTAILEFYCKVAKFPSISGNFYLNTGHARGDELEHGHLGGGVLHGDAVGAEVQVGLAATDVGGGWLVQVTVDDLEILLESDQKQKN